jgi:hypothetical protein
MLLLDILSETRPIVEGFEAKYLRMTLLLSIPLIGRNMDRFSVEWDSVSPSLHTQT